MAHSDAAERRAARTCAICGAGDYYAKPRSSASAAQAVIDDRAVVWCGRLTNFLPLRAKLRVESAQCIVFCRRPLALPHAGVERMEPSLAAVLIAC